MAKKYEFFMQNLLKESNKNRFWLTIFVIVTFLAILAGIGIAMYNNTKVDGTWKELLLLLLGSFLTSYGKVMDHWFTNNEFDKELLAKADEEDDFIQEGLKRRIESDASLLPSVDTPCTCGENEVCSNCSQDRKK